MGIDVSKMSKQEHFVMEQRAKTFISKSLPDMMKKEKNFFARMAKNPNLTAQQHAFLAEMATVRHYIHCHPEQVYWETKLQKKIEAFMGYIQYQEAVNELGIDFPYDVCREFAELPHYALDENYHPKELLENVRTFAKMSEKLNTVFEQYLQTIGKKYGVDYSPSGSLREERNLADDHTENKILNLYFTQGQSLNDELSVIQFETELKKELIARYPKLQGHVNLRFDKQTVDEVGNPIYNVFVEASDYVRLPEDDIQFGNFRLNLNPVLDTSTAVQQEFPRRKQLLENQIERR